VSEHAFGKFPTVFVRLKGRNGTVREFNALVDVGAEYCVVPKVDAYMLGYQEAANDDPITPADNTLTFTSYDGYGKVALIEMDQVDLGSMSFRKVDFVAFDLPQASGFDVILGRSLLRFMKLEFDYSLGKLRMEEMGKSVGP
jgi:predicted aspartyl protease